MSRNKRKSVSEWQALINEQSNSDLSVKRFCRERGLVSKTFYNKRRKLVGMSEADDLAKQGFVKALPNGFSPIASPGSLVLQYRSSRLEFSGAVSPTWLAELMRVLP